MKSSKSSLFNSAQSFGSSGVLALGKKVSITRNVVWLTILLAGVYSSAFAQRGVQEFISSGTFQVPAGVSELRVDANGTGGGGGGSNSNLNGGGGGGGAYTSGVITVSPGEILTIVIGAGGAGGLAGNPAGAGSSGVAAKVLDPSKAILFSANAGKGGQGASGGANGSGGVGGTMGTFGSIRHAGQNGNSFGGGGAGYLPAGFSLIFIQNGKFGTGGDGGTTGRNGGSGQAGYILITW